PGLDVRFRGDLSLRINTGQEEVAEVVTIGKRMINVALPAGPYLQIAATNLDLVLFGQTLRGNFVFAQATLNGQQILRIAASEIFVGIGDGTQNLVSINQGTGAIRISAEGVAGAIGGNFTASIPGVSITGDLQLLFNSSTAAVDETIVIPGKSSVLLEVPAGSAASPFFRFRGEALEVNIAGQVLIGTFGFEKNGNGELRFLVEDASLSLGDGFTDLTDINGAFLVTAAGTSGVLTLGPEINLGPISIGADQIQIRINTGLQPVILDDAAMTRLPGGPFFEISALGGFLDVEGFRLNADFFIRSETTTGGGSRLTLAIRGLNLSFSGISISEGEGVLLILPDAVNPNTGEGIAESGGIAGSLSAMVDLGDAIPGAELSGNFSIQINTIPGAVSETIQLGDSKVVIDLPAGPFFRVGVADATLSIDDQSIGGNFSIEQITLSDNSKILKIAATDVEMNLGDGTTDYIVFSGGTGLLLSTSEGIAGGFSGNVALQNLDSISLNGDLVLEINQTGAAVDQKYEINERNSEGSIVGAEKTLVMDAGTYIRFTASEAELEVAGQTLSGNFFFERSSTVAAVEAQPARSIIRLGGSDIGFFVGDDIGTDNMTDDAGLRMIGGGSLALIISTDGVAGEASGTVDLTIPGLAMTTAMTKATVTVQINNTNKAAKATFTISSVNGSENLSLDLVAGVYFRVEITKNIQGEEFSLD
ncbi:hypothetical protein N9594_01580, partial [bacterium]|nr:hypothetical protein [bacterium]